MTEDMIPVFIACGTKAVLELRDPYLESESLIREVALSQRMADIIRTTHAWNSTSEFKYTRLLHMAKLDVSSVSIVNQFGLLSADIVVLRDGCTPAVLEVKIFKDYGSFRGIRDDRDRLRSLARVVPIDGYVGVFVCQDRAKPLRGTIAEMQNALTVPITVGDIHLSKDGGGWEWAFVCAKVTGQPEP